MKITFLGTGTSQGIPVINSDHPVCFSEDPRDKRLRVSLLLEWDDSSYVIDCGPDFRYQMLRSNIRKVDGILFTHEHSDHVAGLDDIRPYCFQYGAMPIYALPRVMKSLEKRFDYIFQDENKYPGAPSVIQNIVEDSTFFLKDMEVEPIRVMHGNLPILGYKFKDFAYLTDVKTLEDSEKEKLKGLKVLVVNALRYEPHYTHMNIEEALALVDELKPEKVYFTHISHALGFHSEVSEKLPRNVFLAYDTLELTI